MEFSRLQNVTIRDFRSVRGSLYVPLDAPVVLIHGPNGTGKTSVMTAIELALTGASETLRRTDSEYLQHLVHVESDGSEISLTASSRDGEEHSQRVALP